MTSDAAVEPAVMHERWTEIDGRRVFYRASDSDGPAMVHVHGFAISGRYLMPTARLLAGEFRTLVPDLPGYGRSQSPPRALDIPALADALASFLDAVEIDRASLVGNSMGCSIIASFARQHPDRIDRAVLVSPAGGEHNLPMPKGLVQLLLDGMREPPTMTITALPDYLRFGPLNALRLFQALVDFPALERFLAMDTPSLAVIGSNDPLQPSRERLEEVAEQCSDWLSMAIIKGAPHAVNYSHPEQLAHLIRSFMDDGDLVGHPDQAHATDVVQISSHLAVARRTRSAR